MSAAAHTDRAEGIELCDAGFFAASTQGGTCQLAALEKGIEPRAWPGFIHRLGGEWVAGPAAENEWMVHPREVSHSFWDRLSLNEADLPSNPVTTCSELAYHFLKDFTHRVVTENGPLQRLGLAVPGAYLQTPEDEELRVGLLLGIAQDLRLPLVVLTDLASAALAASSRPTLGDGPVIVVDVHLHATELTLLHKRNGVWSRGKFLLVPNVGQVPILRHLMGTMGNRFLRQTAFDIQEDRRLEQVFYYDLKRFYEAGAARPHEQVFQINTTRRSYEMKATREQLSGDLQGFERQVVQAVQRLAGAGEPPRVLLTSRTAQLDGLDALLQRAGFLNPQALPDGAAAVGAALFAARHPACDLLEVPVLSNLPAGLPSDGGEPGLEWEYRSSARPRAPLPLTHVVVDGRAWPQEGLTLRLVADADSLRFVCGANGATSVALAEVAAAAEGLVITGPQGRSLTYDLTPGGRLIVRREGRQAELWGIHCPASPQNVGAAPLSG